MLTKSLLYANSGLYHNINTFSNSFLVILAAYNHSQYAHYNPEFSKSNYHN